MQLMNVHHTKKTTPTRWRRKRRTAGTNVTKTPGRVERNHNSATAGRYNINKTTPTRWRRKRRTAGANVTKTAGRVERNYNRTAGRYNIL
jgi:CRISPR/Cas system endoribonuclease Cas6 (RAMP superfamily)